MDQPHGEIGRPRAGAPFLDRRRVAMSKSLEIGPGTFAATGDFSRMSGLYFSFITLATLGYGDIVPQGIF
jgi:Ion channel